MAGDLVDRRRDGHSSGMPVAGRLKQPTRATRPADGPRASCEGASPYSVLLPAGLALPPTSPPTRCALTSPFHPYRPGGRRFAFCGAFPGVAPAGRYPAPCPRGARTFLRPKAAAVQPADRRHYAVPGPPVKRPRQIGANLSRIKLPRWRSSYERVATVVAMSFWTFSLTRAALRSGPYSFEGLPVITPAPKRPEGR